MTLNEKNALIAEKVLNLTVSRNERGGWSLGKPDYYDDRGEMLMFNPLPNYFEDIASAWEVASYFASQGIQVRISNKAQSNEYWWCYMDSNDSNVEKGIAQGSTISEAICLASLRHLGVEI